ncbi:unnamed protein product [Paramecium octaurelia]|uniref:Uncharacterized protein n=1 Tax=Paramecium octaurelia TaxID=43137 RepID=A0A8S1VI43_PAROT|nr:unnamed protein product [Paramecium octaurelia]
MDRVILIQKTAGNLYQLFLINIFISSHLYYRIQQKQNDIRQILFHTFNNDNLLLLFSLNNQRITFRKYISWPQSWKSQSFKLTILMSLFTIYIAKFIDGELFWLFACNSFLLNPQQQIKNYKINQQQQPTTQDELNELYELQQHNLTKNHAYINYTLIITNIYRNLILINQIMTFIGLSLYNWADKYILLNHSTVKHQPSSSLSLEMFTLISYTPIIISCQHLMNSNEDQIPQIQLISAFVFYLIPKDLIINKIWKIKKSRNFLPMMNPNLILVMIGQILPYKIRQFIIGSIRKSTFQTKKNSRFTQ